MNQRENIDDNQDKQEQEMRIFNITKREIGKAKLIIEVNEDKYLVFFKFLIDYKHYIEIFKVSLIDEKNHYISNEIQNSDVFDNRELDNILQFLQSKNDIHIDIEINNGEDNLKQRLFLFIRESNTQPGSNKLIAVYKLFPLNIKDEYISLYNKYQKLNRHIFELNEWYCKCKYISQNIRQLLYS